LGAFEEFMDKKEKGMRAEVKERIAEAVARRLVELKLGIEALDQPRLRRGFWKPIFERFEAKKITRPEGGSWGSVGRVSEYFKRHKTAIRQLIEKRLPITLAPSKHDCSEDMEARLMNLEKAVHGIQNELQALRADRSTAVSTPELVPLPPREGRQFVAARSQFATIIDQVLLDGLKDEARQRGTTFTRMIETAIWHFLGKPPLSFEIDGPADENEQ